MNTCTGTDVNSSFNDLYKEFRNKLRLYHPLSVIRAALATLRKMSGDRVQDLKMAPWHVLLIVKWILQDKMTGDRPISLAQFDDLRQRLHEFPERMASPARVPFPLFVRRLVHQQIAFQREMTGGFIREAALLEALPSAHPLRMQFQARAGITPEHFIDLSLATYTAIVVDGKVSLPFNWFASLHETYGPAVLESFYSLASRDFGELRDFCRALRERIPRVASEYYESTPLRRFPFFRSEHGL